MIAKTSLKTHKNQKNTYGGYVFYKKANMSNFRTLCLEMALTYRLFHFKI